MTKSVLLIAGEESGDMPGLLSKMADFYDVEVESLIAQVTSIIEPVMILGMGIVVGFVLIAVFTPVYQLIQQF